MEPSVSRSLVFSPIIRYHDPTAAYWAKRRSPIPRPSWCLARVTLSLFEQLSNITTPRQSAGRKFTHSGIISYVSSPPSLRPQKVGKTVQFGVRQSTAVVLSEMGKGNLYDTESPSSLWMSSTQSCRFVRGGSPLAFPILHLQFPRRTPFPQTGGYKDYVISNGY